MAAMVKGHLIFIKYAGLPIRKGRACKEAARGEARGEARGGKGVPGAPEQA